MSILRLHKNQDIMLAQDQDFHVVRTHLFKIDQKRHNVFLGN
jgi:hypothetical protein